MKVYQRLFNEEKNSLLESGSVTIDIDELTELVKKALKLKGKDFYLSENLGRKMVRASGFHTLNYRSKIGISGADNMVLGYTVDDNEEAVVGISWDTASRVWDELFYKEYPKYEVELKTKYAPHDMDIEDMKSEKMMESKFIDTVWGVFQKYLKSNLK